MTFFGITVLEPTTVITDFILAGLCFYFGHCLYWHSPKATQKNLYIKRYSQYWGIAFLFSGIASFMGALVHGFSPLSIQYPILEKAWPFVVLSMGMMSFYLLLAITLEYFPRYRNVLFFVAYFKLMIFLLLMLGYPQKYFGELKDVSFGLVILDYVPVLLLLLIMNLKEFLKSRSLGAKTMVIGILVSVVGTLIQLSHVRISENFNHNDIYHIIQMYALYLMYKAITLKNKNYL